MEGPSLIGDGATTTPVERMTSDQQRELFKRQYQLEGQLSQLPSHRETTNTNSSPRGKLS